MRSPLLKALNDKKTHTSFHTPGHNGGIVIDSRLDVTELSFSDNLLNAEGAILESEKEVALSYGVERVLYSTAGATALIHTVIRALRNKGTFLIFGSAHKSVYNALAINRVKSVLYRGADLRGALKKSGAKVVICTSPNYFGRVLPLEEISRISRDCGAVLVVDASHGAHFAFSTKLPISATNYAPLVIHSQHKVMPAITGGASLCYKSEYEKELLRAFREIHTTSPSYLVMLSIESAVKELSENGEALYDRVIGEINHFKTRSLGAPFSIVESDDPTRLVIEVRANGDNIAKELEDKGIYPEMVYGNKLVFIVTPYNYMHLDNLSDALLDCTYQGEYEEVSLPKCAEYLELVLDGECEEVALEDSVGRVSGKEVGLYPPGVPVIVRGEKITKEQVDFLLKYRSAVFGLENNGILVLK